MIHGARMKKILRILIASSTTTSGDLQNKTLQMDNMVEAGARSHPFEREQTVVAFLSPFCEKSTSGWKEPAFCI